MVEGLKLDIEPKSMEEFKSAAIIAYAFENGQANHNFEESGELY